MLRAILREKVLFIRHNLCEKLPSTKAHFVNVPLGTVNWCSHKFLPEDHLFNCSMIGCERSLCIVCSERKPQIRRPSTMEPYCRECFYEAFELEVHHTILGQKLFDRNDRVAIAVSGGKGKAKSVEFYSFCLGYWIPSLAMVRFSDSTVLAHLMTTLNRRYDYGLDLFLLAVDEGITVNIQ